MSTRRATNHKPQTPKSKEAAPSVCPLCCSRNGGPNKMDSTTTKDDDHDDHGSTITLYLIVTAAAAAASEQQQQQGAKTTRVPLKIQPSITTPKALRLKVSLATKIPISSLKLLYRGRLIDDDHHNNNNNAVEEYKLEEGSVLQCKGTPVIAAEETTAAADQDPTCTPASNLLVVDGTTTSGNYTIQAALATLYSLNPLDVYQDAVQALDKIISNITMHPMESKYCTIKLQNANFHRRLGVLPGGHAVMKAAGFTVQLEKEERNENGGSSGSSGSGGGEQVYVLRLSPEAWPCLVAIQAAVKEAAAAAAAAAANNAAQTTASSTTTRDHDAEEEEEEEDAPMAVAAAAAKSADSPPPPPPPPPPEILHLWNAVGNGLEESQTVEWQSAVVSLDHANKTLQTSQEARIFLEKYMTQIINILVQQQTHNIGPYERDCVQDSLSLAVDIITQDLTIQNQQNGECLLLPALAHVFNKKKGYYKNTRRWYDTSIPSGLPEIRMKMIHRFRKSNGFRLLNLYMVHRIGTPSFPTVEHICPILSATGDAILRTRPAVATPAGGPANQDPNSMILEVEDDAISISNSVMQSINNMSEDDLKKVPVEQLEQLPMDLKNIFDQLAATRRSSTHEFYSFWRCLALRLITNPSLPLNLFGWDLVNKLILACAEHRPPPRYYIVTNAGCPFINGKYDYAGPVAHDGYATGDVSYVRKIPEGEEQGGHKFTLFCCTTRSHQKWWFISEADEEEPGTDRDIDYYRHKSKEGAPPPLGWTTCRSAGMDPPPHLKQYGCMVPPGEEHNTLEHQLAKWAIDNNIVEQVLGNTTIHHEVVTYSTTLINFLAQMCTRDVADAAAGEDMLEPNKYCLQKSHLLLAWKTCTRKAEAAVATRVYQLLVSILPLCPSDLGVPLLKAVKETLTEPNKDNHDYLFEVGAFCGALATGNLVEFKNGNSSALLDEVRKEALNLLLSVLTHPDAAALESYDDLKRYVTLELRHEPEGSELRERFEQLDITLSNSVEEDVVAAAGTFMQSFNNMSDDDLKEMRMGQLIILQKDLRNISHNLLAACRNNTYEFHTFWRGLALRLINGQSLPLKLFGWECVSDLIDACIALRPPPRYFFVTNAGCSFVNGTYDYAGPLTLDGYAEPGGDIRYVRTIPEGEEHGGHKLTIFRRTLCLSHQKWWFVSEADEEQPGTDRDIDYYQHKSKKHEEDVPPPRGWTTCLSGIDPPPHLKAQGGCIVPPGEEDNTLEHQLAKWVIENQIVEQLVLGETTIHREEVVARSKALIKLFAHMCRRDDDAAASEVFLNQLLAMESFRVV